MAALFAAAGCSSDKSAQQAPAAGEAAGVVVSVSGTVSIERAGDQGVERKSLSEGDEVRGSDVVTTGQDGEVAIKLFHNDVVWSLDSGKRKRVDGSLAWKAPKSAGGGMLAKTAEADKTSAAGRHAEKSAADTRATAAREAEARLEEQMERAQAEESRADREAARARLEKLKSETAKRKKRTRRAKTRSKPKSAPKRDIDDLLSGGITSGGPGGGGGGFKGGNIGTSGSGGGTSGGGRTIETLKAPAAPPSGRVTLGLTRGGADVATVFRRALPAFRSCYRAELAKTPTLAGKVRLLVTISAEGKVTKVFTAGDPIVSKVKGCFVAKAKTLRFPPNPDGKTITGEQTFELAAK